MMTQELLQKQLQVYAGEFHTVKVLDNPSMGSCLVTITGETFPGIVTKLFTKNVKDLELGPTWIAVQEAVGW